LINIRLLFLNGVETVIISSLAGVEELTRLFRLLLKIKIYNLFTFKDSSLILSFNSEFIIQINWFPVKLKLKPTKILFLN